MRDRGKGMVKQNKSKKGEEETKNKDGRRKDDNEGETLINIY